MSAIDAQVIDFHAEGLSMPHIAARLGKPYGSIYGICRRLGLEFPHANKKAKGSDKRADAMAALYRAGYTLEQIGQQYGMTRERARQIMTKHLGIRRKDGGKAKQASVKRASRQRDKDRECFGKHGCSRAQYKSLMAIGREMEARGICRERTPIGAFCTQRCNSRRRQIGWELKLWEWWQIWHESGRWEQRGVGQGYVMARLNDEGPYAAGNVYITTAIDNIVNAPKRPKKSGLPLGVRKVKGRDGFFAQRQVNGNTSKFGPFPTPELAHAAYIAAGPMAA